jgi:hypothetical protein
VIDRPVMRGMMVQAAGMGAPTVMASLTGSRAGPVTLTMTATPGGVHRSGSGPGSHHL